MEQGSYAAVIQELTRRALWEVGNIIDCIPDADWRKPYCKAPLWKHIYHMLHSLDLWFMNPRDPSFQEPDIHEAGLNDLDAYSVRELTRAEIEHYLKQIESKLTSYLENLQDEQLLEAPTACEYTRFTLILAQFRHLHTHMGMLMGFIITSTGRWPYVVGLECPIPKRDYKKYE